MTMNYSNTNKKSGSTGLFIVLIVAAIITCVGGCMGCSTVDTHEVGIKTMWGKINSEPLGPGLYWVAPIGGWMVKYDARERKTTLKAPTYTRDMQPADLELVITYTLDRTRIKDIHTQYGKDWAEKIVNPIVVAVTKDVIGQWEADKLVNGREQATVEINKMVQEKLADKPVKFSQLVIENIDFSDAFEKAIEAKQIATQEAIKAKNKTVQIEEESRQEVIRAKAKAEATVALAKAEAEALEIRGKALKENQDLIMLQFVEKWDGKSPNTLILGEGANPFINAR